MAEESHSDGYEKITELPEKTHWSRSWKKNYHLLRTMREARASTAIVVIPLVGQSRCNLSKCYEFRGEVPARRWICHTIWTGRGLSDFISYSLVLDFNKCLLLLFDGRLPVSRMVVIVAGIILFVEALWIWYMRVRCTPCWMQDVRWYV